MRIAVIGTGKIGATLGGALARAGHDVALGSRAPQDRDVVGPPVVSIGAALDGAQIVLLALPGSAVEDFLAEHSAAVDGKIVIDATNRIGAPVVNAAAAIVQAAPNVRYVRAFNTLGWENFAQPDFDGLAADLFFSAPEAERETVEGLISDVGLRPAFLGAGKEDLVDTVLPLWLTLIQLRGRRHLAFRVLAD
jgi:predicted dinucleotide-binding enzyme